MAGTPGNDTLFGTAADDVLIGYAGDDKLFGLDGDDLLMGGLGADIMYGGRHDDTYWVDNAGDKVNEFASERNDQVISSIDYVLPNNVETLWLDVSSTAGSGTGNAQDNFIYGNSRNNALHGGGGDDSLIGRGGSDYLLGGAGGDHFIWRLVNETGLTEATADMVADFDFSQGDRLDLAQADGNALVAGTQHFTFIGQAAFSGTPGEIRYYHFDGRTFFQLQTGVEADVEGVICLVGIHDPTASWFIL